MDPALAKAMKRRENLLKELETLDKFIELFGQLFGDDDKESTDVAHRSDVPQTPDLPHTPRRRLGKPAEIADAAERAIRRAGRPMARGELVDEIESEGVGIHSNDKARYVGTILWRNSGRFVNVEGQGYWLKDQPLDSRPDDANLFENR